jgi:hypothetical protein
MTKPKKNLKIEYSFENEFDFTLIGISCHQKQFKLCWAINKYTPLKFIRIEDFKLETEKQPSYFSQSCFEDREKETNYFLIENKGIQYAPNEKQEPTLFANDKKQQDAITIYLINEKKQFDYLMLIKPFISSNEIEELLKKIKNIDFIISANVLEIQSINARYNLLF